MSRGFASNYRMAMLAAGLLAVFGGLGARLVSLHVLDRQRLVSYVEQARRQIIVENAQRGDILDSRGGVLATSHSLIELGVDPHFLRPEDESKWPELARLLGWPLPELQRVFTTRTRPAGNNDPLGEPRPIRWVKLSETVEEATYDRINALGIRGVYGHRKYRRIYPHNQLAAHVVGYVNKENVAVQGVERFGDFYLRGQNGWRESERDGLRRELAQFRSREVPPTKGYSMVLSIDAVVQHYVERELERIAQQFKPKKATILVSEAATGFLLAMANYPTFNLNEYNQVGPDEVGLLNNVALTEILEPGSTFKIVPAAGALNEGLVNPLTRFDCTLDRVEYRGRVLRLPRDDHPVDRPLSVTEVISRSSNRGAAQLGVLLGEQRLYGYARAFGFGEYSEFPTIGREEPGLLAKPERWSRIDVTRIPIGHTVAATPLQIHYAMGVIASGGELLRPQIVREVRDASGETVYRFGPVARRRVISEVVAAQMAQMLSRVTISGEGTASQAAIENFDVAGKTGTSQKIINGKYSNRHHIGSFVGFFPASRPAVVISIIVDEGRSPTGGAGYGGVVAAPSFRRIGEQLIQYLDIKPTHDPGKSLLAMEGARR